MGNYADLRIDFVTRTMSLIEQYNDVISVLDLPFNQQFNYTLTINCLLGLIVMPKENVESYIPNERLTSQYKQNALGFVESWVNEDVVTTLRDLIVQLRNSISHFSIDVESLDQRDLIDYLVFRHEDGREIAKIKSSEMVPFLKSYSQMLLANLHRGNNS